MPLAGFHPTVQRWFAERLGEPTLPQSKGWPAIRAGEHTLIAAPTGSGKTLAAFLHALDQLLRQGDRLLPTTQVLYISPLKALSNDVAKNLEAPLAEILELDPSLPEISVLVRTGDTKASDRQRMVKKPPHILVTTPESLFILLTTQGGRRLLQTVRSVIVDEIHALLRDKRGSHLALSLERLVALAGEVQRIGLSATQKPLAEVGKFLVGGGRSCTLVDIGHRRALDLQVEVPTAPLTAVCSHEVFDEIYAQIAALIGEHRTTLVFVNTRKLAERAAARLAEKLGPELVTSHHGSLSKERRLDAEQRLKAGKLKALVATASLELGIDIGDVDLVVQIGVTPSIATLLQRVGRAGHGVGRLPKGRVFPLTLDELVAAAALLACVKDGVLDATPKPPAALDILAQQIVAACVTDTWHEDELWRCLTRAFPYRELTRADFDATAALHLEGRGALLHRDGVGHKLRATKRARITAATSGGAIPDNADYQVVQQHDGTNVGSVHEDFAIESDAGDIFQLGNQSWQILRVARGIVYVADAKGAPPTLPFWIGEAPARTRELAAAVAQLRGSAASAATLIAELGLPGAAAEQIAEYLQAGALALGANPTQQCIVAERFADESGGAQLILHAPFGGRINRALGLALRKRFCRSFGFELQAAANEDAILISLGPHHSFTLPEVAHFLHCNTVRQVLTQALLAAPMFQSRWRWNVTRSLLVARHERGKRVPAPLLRMRADDALVRAFPQSMACPETLPGGDLPIPLDHVLVRQTVEDCLTEAMDVDGLVDVLRGIQDGSIAWACAETAAPSPFAEGILAAKPYAFLDDAPLEERRTQAVLARRSLAGVPPPVGELDPQAVQQVRDEIWPRPSSAEEVHEALGWMGYVTTVEAAAWQPWLDELAAQGRIVREADRIYAAETSRDPVVLWRGRLEALGPVHSDDPDLLHLQAQGTALRVQWLGKPAWCDRRLLARIQRYMVERLRRGHEPVTPAVFMRALACWQHVDPEHRLEGPEGVYEVLHQLAGYEAPAAMWEKALLPARVRGYRREWLDELMLHGRLTFVRLWGSGAGAMRTTPLCFVPRDDLDAWLALAPVRDATEFSGPAQQIHAALTQRGAMFTLELERATKLLRTQLEHGLAELIARGWLGCDSFAAVRQLLVPPSKRRLPIVAAGRFSLLPSPQAAEPPSSAWVAEQYLRRFGVVFKRLLARERLPVAWRDLLRVLRSLELQGKVHGGRFVQGFDGEQFALPEAARRLRQCREQPATEPLRVWAADPLNLRGILTTDARVPPTVRVEVAVG